MFSSDLSSEIFYFDGQDSSRRTRPALSSGVAGRMQSGAVCTPANIFLTLITSQVSRPLWEEQQQDLALFIFLLIVLTVALQLKLPKFQGLLFILSQAMWPRQRQIV